MLMIDPHTISLVLLAQYTLQVRGSSIHKHIIRKCLLQYVTHGETGQTDSMPGCAYS